MAVVIRMKRTGRRNRPSYRISVADRALPRDGRTLENLGHYDPASPKPELRLKVDVERAHHWLSEGAQPSETVRSILRREGAYEGIPTPKQRTRPGRKKTTARGAMRRTEKEARQAAKEARHADRIANKRAAKKAAAEAEASDES